MLNNDFKSQTFQVLKKCPWSIKYVISASFSLVLKVPFLTRFFVSNLSIRIIHELVLFSLLQVVNYEKKTRLYEVICFGRWTHGMTSYLCLQISNYFYNIKHIKPSIQVLPVLFQRFGYLILPNRDMTEILMKWRKMPNKIWTKTTHRPHLNDEIQRGLKNNTTSAITELNVI